MQEGLAIAKHLTTAEMAWFEHGLTLFDTGTTYDGLNSLEPN